MPCEIVNSLDNVIYAHLWYSNSLWLWFSFPALVKLICFSDRNYFYFICSHVPLDLQGKGWEASEMGATSTEVLEQVEVQVDGESSKGIPHPQVVFAKLQCLSRISKSNQCFTKSQKLRILYYIKLLYFPMLDTNETFFYILCFQTQCVCRRHVAGWPSVTNLFSERIAQCPWILSSFSSECSNTNEHQDVVYTVFTKYKNENLVQ